MSSALMAGARDVAQSADPMEPITYGPWLGANLALPDDLVTREYVADGQNYRYLSAFGYWDRRGGQTQKFDTFGAAVGMLPAKWSAKARWMEEFLSSSLCSDGVPSIGALLTRETISSGLDDGRFSQFWMRDQVANANYTLGSEYNATEYPTAGTEQRYKVVPLWYDSGDGGMTRGVTEFMRRLFLGGSRRYLKVGNWWYFPNVLGVPCRWNGEKATATSTKKNRLIPSGPISPTHSGTVVAGTPSSDGPWLGSDRFGYSVLYVFEDGSYWAPCPVRKPNDILPNGFGVATVDATNPAVRYRSVIFSNLPIGPHGVAKRVICRTHKVDSTGPNPLNFSPHDLRPIPFGIIHDNTTTSWECFDGDDASLQSREVSELFVRHDLMMPPRARYVFGGDMRICHGYGGDNPCAIQIAPVGFTADYDLNVKDDSSTAYANNQFIGLIFSASAGNALRLAKDASNTALALTTYNTIQKLVDRINASTASDDGGQWRAQICPGVNGEASVVDTLTPHIRAIAACQYDSGVAAINCSAGGLSKVPVGALVEASSFPADWPAGTYVTRIQSDTQLITSAAPGNTRASTEGVFATQTGDTWAGLTGYQRVIANSLPGFLYFNKTELDKGTFDKSAIWMTTASPGQTKSAPNCFTRNISNRHTPPIHAGQCMGGGAVDNGFVVLWANKRGAIRNTRDSGTGEDKDYRLFITNETSGCISWNTVVPGNRFVPCLGPEGIVCADLFKEELVSEGIWVRSVNEGDTTSELNAQINNDAAATAADTDTSRSHLRIMRGVMHLGYHPTAGSSHPSRRLEYDFSGGVDANGLAALMRSPGVPWGWSVKQIQSFSMMAEARRSDGPHLYGWNEENGGSTGDGRIDEFETGDTDNGTAISGIVSMPWARADVGEYVTAQEIRAEHSTPAASTVKVDLMRSFVNQTQYEMTPTGEDSVSVTDMIKKLPQAARVVTDGVFVRWRQTAGVGGQLRRIQLRLKRRKRYK